MAPQYNMSEIVEGIKLENIPDTWIFFHFCLKHGRELFEENFDGRSLRIRSFWSDDSTPSLYFFVGDDGAYKFKCFATGRGGGSVMFVRELENKTDWDETVQIIKREYAEFKNLGGKWTVPIKKKFMHKNITGTKFEYKRKMWDPASIEYWNKYKITPDTLVKYRVSPIDSYIVYSNDIPYTFVPNLAYVFETKDEIGYQLYQPDNDPKYLLMDNTYLPGWDQLKMEHDTLAIMSGLKDIMALNELGLNVDMIAARTEATMVDEDVIKLALENYKKVVSLCDYDKTGLKIMRLYEKKYDIKPVIIPGLEKDVAEMLKRHHKDYVKSTYAMEINKIISK